MILEQDFRKMKTCTKNKWNRHAKSWKKYAEALFEVTENLNTTNSVIDDVNLISDTFCENSELRTFMSNPIIKLEDKKDAIKQIFEGKVSETAINLLYLLADNSRFDAISEIKNAYIELINQKQNLMTVKAVTAVEMKDYLKEKLKRKLEEKLSKQVEIEYSIDPEIVGGMIVESDGKTIDNSVVTKLKNIKKQLI